MKIYDPALTAYREAGGEFWPLHLFSIKAKDRDTGGTVWYHFTTADEDRTIQVRNSDTGSLEARTFLGGGHVVSHDPLIRSGGTQIRKYQISFSGTSPVVREMVYNREIRDAAFEWHIGELHQDTGKLIAIPELEFEGFVDEAGSEDSPLSIGSGEASGSTITLYVTGILSFLLWANHDLRTYETGLQRNDDGIFRFAAESNTWDIPWGEENKKAKKADNSDGRDPTIDPNTYGRR